MQLTDKQKKWIITHFKNTKNDEIMMKMGINHSALHRFAREHGLKKTKQFQRKCQLEASRVARITNKRNNWPPKGYEIPKSQENCFKKGHSGIARWGVRKERIRIEKAAESRRQTIRSEKRRVLFGLPQKTKLKVVAAPRAKNAYRHLLKKRGYIVSRASKEIYYADTTLRNEKAEQKAFDKYRFTFKPMKTYERN
jgi:hypothetical protein